MKKSRNLWMDLLNVFACMGVVLLHCTNRQIHSFDCNQDFSFYVGAFTHSFFYWPVPIFLMLSGANLLGYEKSWKTFYKRRFLRTVVPFLGWSVFYGLVMVLFKWDEYTVKTFVEDFFNGKLNGHMWFFIPLFSLYLSMPFLSSFIRTISVRLSYWFLAIAFVFVSVIPCVFNFLDLSIWEGTLFPMGTRYFIFAILGYCICHKTDWFDTNRKMIYCLGLLSAIIQFVLLIMIVPIGELRYRDFLGYEYPFSFMIALSVFLLFKNIKWHKLLGEGGQGNRIIREMSSCSLGIYLFHAVLFMINGYFELNIRTFYGFFVVYIISLIVVWIMKKIPIIKYIVP